MSRSAISSDSAFEPVHGIGDDPVLRARIEEHLVEVLGSAAFSGSRRSQDFLSFVVHRWLDQREHTIRERTIAQEVFGRPTSYDPSEDSFVRVKASELRKRLADHYTGPGAGSDLRIEIPLGGYVPSIRRRDRSAAVVEMPAVVAPETHIAPVLEPAAGRSRSRMLPALAAAVLAILAVLLALAFLRPKPPALDRFWQPVLQSASPVLISIPSQDRFVLLGPAAQAVMTGQLPPVRSVEGVPVYSSPQLEVHRKDDVVGMGAGVGAAHLAAMLARAGKLYHIKVGRDVAFADLRSQPTILLGGFSSRWGMEMQKGLRFQLRQGPARVIDTEQPDRVWIPAKQRPDGRADIDYAVVTRIVDSASSGQAFITASGITTFATQAAAEFLTSEAVLDALLATAPPNWSGRNLQIVLRTNILADTPGPPHLEAAHFW